MKQYAYIRVSSKDQNVDRQLLALKEFQIPEKQIFCDYQSGKDFNRPAYRKLIKKLRSGDLLIIKSIDRLGRNYSEILEQWRLITQKIGADILVLDMNLLDTRNKDNNLTGTLIADLVLQIFAYVAETERTFIRQRQKEGIAAALAKGTHFGRKAMEVPEDFEKYCILALKGNLTQREAAELLGVSQSTFCRWMREYKEKCILMGDSDSRLFESMA